MRTLTPDFVLQAIAAGATGGKLRAVCLFADVSGFTPLTTQLMQHGSEGAEVLSDVLAALFEPLTAAVTARGGTVVGYAGDAFKAIFPLDRADPGHTYRTATAAAWAILGHFKHRPTYTTRFGVFEFSGKVCLADGPVEWLLWRTEADLAAGDREGESTPQRAAVAFSGGAINACMQLDPLAHRGEAVVSSAVHAALAGTPAHWSPVESAWRLERWPPDASSPLAGRPAGISAGAVPPPLTHPDPAVTALLAADRPPDAADQRAVADELFPAALYDSPIAGEFRRVVTLFVNAAQDATALAQAGFPHLLFDLLDRHRGFLCRVGRTGSKDGGVTLLIFFGAPTGHEQDVPRALHFALDLLAQSPVPIRAGITTSLAFAGFVGSSDLQEYTCHGPYVNLAARLMATAPPGALWLDAETARRAGPGWDLEALGEQSFKGFATSQTVFRLRGHTTVAPFYAGEFVGRDRELAALHAAARPLWAGRNAGVALVVGEAGLGKSRLVHTFQAATEHQPDPAPSPRAQPQAHRRGLAQWLVCQTDELVRAPLNPFRYWLRRHFHQQSHQDAAANQQALDRGLDDLIVHTADPALAADLERARPYLATLLELPVHNAELEQLDPRLRFDNTLDGIKTLVKALTQVGGDHQPGGRRPAVLLVEDAQWLDADSKTLLARLLINVEPWPFLVVLAVRPEGDFAPPSATPPEQDQLEPNQPQPRISLPDTAAASDPAAPAWLPAWLPAHAPHHLVRLTPLAGTDFAALVAQRLGGAPAPALLHFLAAQSEGFPFFVEQLLLYLQENQLLVSGPAGWNVAPGQDAGALLPGDVRSVLTARLDRLPLDVRLAVQTASVLGRAFDTHILAAMLAPADTGSAGAENSGAPATLARQLAAGEAAGIWSRMAADDYLFRHSLLREAAYDMQLRTRLRKLHARAVAAIEQVYAADLGPHYAALVLHTNHAEAFDQERTYALLAGRYAADRYANADAVRFYSRALDLLPAQELTARGDVLVAREKAYDVLGNRAAQQEDLDQLDALVAASGHAEHAVQLALRRGVYYRITGSYTQALAAVDTAVALAHAHELESYERAALHLRGRILWQQGQYGPSRTTLQQALDLATQRGHQHDQAQALYDISNTYFYAAQWERAHDLLTQALPLYQATADRQGEANCYLMFGSIAFRQGNYGPAMAQLEQGLTLARTIGWRHGESYLLGALGNVYFDLGDFPAAATHHDEALRTCRELQDREGEAVSLDTLGLIASIRGRSAEAAGYFAAALAIQEAIGDHRSAAYTLTHRGYLLANTGEYAAAQADFAAAQAIRTELGEEEAAIDSAAGLALVAWRTGERTAADQARLLAGWLAEHPDLPVEYPTQVLLICHEILAACGEPEQAGAALAQAAQFVRARAECIADPALRRQFLQQGYLNAAVLSLAG